VKKRTTPTAWWLSAILAVPLLGGIGLLGVRYHCRLSLFQNRQWYFGELDLWEEYTGAPVSASKLIGHGFVLGFVVLEWRSTADPWPAGF
jgi:hypothetical protein